MVAVSVDQPGQAGREPGAAEKLRTGPDKLINLKKTAEFERLIEICTAKIRKQPGQEAIRAVLIRASAFTKQGVASETLAAGNRARSELHAHLFAEYVSWVASVTFQLLPWQCQWHVFCRIIWLTRAA